MGVLVVGRCSESSRARDLFRRDAADAPRSESSVDELEDLLARYETNPPWYRHEWVALLRRLQGVGPRAESHVVKIASKFLEKMDPNDQEVREILGHVEFAHEIPEGISFREYDYMWAVEEAARKRWFPPEDADELRLAKRAWQETLRHRKRLIEDRTFRAIDQARANVANDTLLGAYNYATRWASPYLICYSANERLSDYGLLAISDPAERVRYRNELASRRAAFEAVLDEKASIYQQLYAEFMKRYGAEMKLKPLMDAWGGRPELPVGKRSFQDGAPLIIWIFSDKDAFSQFHSVVKGKEMPAAVAGYFDTRTGWIFLYDEGDDRAYEIDKNVHEGVHQLQHWFTRQLNDWDVIHPRHMLLNEGLAEWIGSVRMSSNGSLEFRGVSANKLRATRNAVRAFEDAGKPYPIYPVRHLTGFRSYEDIARWAFQHFKLLPKISLTLFYLQSWAFVQFLNEGGNPQHRQAFVRYLTGVMKRDRGYISPNTAFENAFHIRRASDWDRLQRGFEDHFRSVILRKDPSDFDYEPPPPQKRAGR